MCSGSAVTEPTPLKFSVKGYLPVDLHMAERIIHSVHMCAQSIIGFFPELVYMHVQFLCMHIYRVSYPFWIMMVHMYLNNQKNNHYVWLINS